MQVKISFLAAVLIFAMMIIACGGGGTPTPTPKTVNDITLTATQLNVPISTYDIGNYSSQAVMVGNNLYFANYSNTAKPQFFVRYNITSNTFSSDLAKSTNVCGCGYMSKLVSDGTNIFYIANDATKYTATTNVWSNLNYPITAKDNAGEAGVVYYNGNIYFLGGRTASTLFKYYSVAQDSWFSSPNYLYPTNQSEMTVYKDKIYVLGGTGAEKKVSYFSITTNTWTALKDAPIAINTSYSNVYSTVLGDDLFLLQGTKVYIYDFVNDLWATNPIDIGSLGGVIGVFSNGIKLYIASKNTSNIPQVYELVVGTS
jgi:hypothetical protein